MTDGLLEHFTGLCWGEKWKGFDENSIRNRFYTFGETPSEIDSELGLREGTAKKVILGDWKDDKGKRPEWVTYE